MSQHPLLDPLEVRKLAAEILEDVVAKARCGPGDRLYDTSGKDWWHESQFQGEIEAEIEEKIADWLEFRLART